MPTIDLQKLYKPFPQQVKAHTAQERYVLYGGAVRGGKTVWLVNEALQLSLETPGNVGWLCRQELTAFRRTTQVTFEKFVPRELIAQHHGTENWYRLVNGSMIYYGGLGDDESGLRRLKSMELGWFGIDQCEEISEALFLFLMTRLNLQLPNIRYKGLLTANPSPGWVKHRFIEQKKYNHVFIAGLPKDNPYLPADYESELRLQYPEELVKQLLDGDWDALEAGNYLFKYADIKNAIERDLNGEHNKVMGVDIARFGDDSSVVMVRQGNKVIWTERWAKTDLMHTTGKVINLIERFNPDTVNLDVIGLGAGVYDRLREQKYHIAGINNSHAPRGKDKAKFTNLRAEAYRNLAKQFEESEISIPDDMELVAQLSGIKYKFNSSGQLQIESKEEMKKRGMKSPDKADALVLCFMDSKSREPSVRWI